MSNELCHPTTLCLPELQYLRFLFTAKGSEKPHLEQPSPRGAVIMKLLLPESTLLCRVQRGGIDTIIGNKL